MPLPLHYLFVAGLGRRDIGPRDAIRAELIAVLRTIAAAAPEAQPVAMASGAAGADQVFLEAAEALGWPIRLVLPVPAFLFEKDFTSAKAVEGRKIEETDAAGLAAFRGFCERAIEVEVLPPPPGRREAFTRCANALVAEADVLVALWDGQAGKQGGTNESLLLARQLEVPTVLLDARTGRPVDGHPALAGAALLARRAVRHGAGTILHDIDQALHFALPPSHRAEFAAAAIGDQHARYGRLLAEQAEKLAQSYKRKNLYAVAMHVLASLIGLLALLFLTQEAAVGTGATVFKLAAVATAFWLAHTAKKFGEHNKWVKARFVREVHRSMGFSAEVARQTGEAHDAFVPSAIWVLFPHLRRPLHLFHGLNLRATARPTLLDALRRFRKKRLAHDPAYREKELRDLSQQDYQRRTEEKATRGHHAIERGFLASTGAFFLCGGLLLTPLFDHAGVAYRLAKWLTVLLPVLSAALLVLPNLWDLHRRRRVAPAVVRTLARLDAEAAEVEKILVALAADTGPTVGPSGVAVWAGSAAEQRALGEAWARARFAALGREAEHAILTELIGFKTFVENAEVG
jgi:hypothetical protein